MRIVYRTSPDPYVNVIIGFSGGLAATIFTGLLFILAQGFQMDSMNGRIPYTELKRVLNVSILSIVLKEAITAFLEGLFHDLYVTIVHTLFWVLFTAFAFIFCFALVMWRGLRRSK
jgi:hypothetical protein